MLFVAANVVFRLGSLSLEPTLLRKIGKDVAERDDSSVCFNRSLRSFCARVTTGGMSPNTRIGMLNIQLLQIVLSWLVGIVFLYLGKMRLGRIE